MVRGFGECGRVFAEFCGGGRFPSGLRFLFFSSLLFSSFFPSLPLSGEGPRRGGVYIERGQDYGSMSCSCCSVIN